MLLEGVIYKANGDPYTGTFQMRLRHAPIDSEGGTTTGITYIINCDGADPEGLYSTTIRAGTYYVDIPGTPRFEVTAFNDDNTYALEDMPRWVDGFDPFPWVGSFRNALTDTDDSVLFDGTEALYDVLDIIDNPLLPTQAFETVADMLASTGGSWDTAYTRNWESGDGNSQRWLMVQDPTLSDNGADVLSMDDGLSFVRTFSTRGPTAGDNFSTLNDVEQYLADSRIVFSQPTPALAWTINHNLGAYPPVTCTDPSGNVIIGDPQYVSENTIVVAHGSPYAGFAYL